MAARRPAVQDSTPQATPAGTPSPTERGQHGHDFTLQAVMEMQKSIGGLESSVKVLGEKFDKQSDSVSDLKKKIGHVEKVMYAAGVILICTLAIGGWLLNSAKDFAMTYYKASLDAQTKTVAQNPIPLPPPIKR